jgi:hypothetical protein
MYRRTIPRYVITHDFNPRFACLARPLKDFGGHLESLRLLKIQHNVALKRPDAGCSAK